MPYKNENIVKGGATLIFAGNPLGYTRDATTMGVEDEKVRIEDVQQVVGVVDVRRTRVGVVIKANLYEFTLENLQKAWGINASIVQTTTKKSLNIDFSGDYPEGELVIYGKGESNVARTITFYKVKLIDRGDIELDADNFSVIPVTFQVLIHPDQNYLGKFEQEYIPSGVVTD